MKRACKRQARRFSPRFYGGALAEYPDLNSRLSFGLAVTDPLFRLLQSKVLTKWMHLKLT